MEIEEILRKVQQGQLSVEEAGQKLRPFSYEEMGFAKLDDSRKRRSGFHEVIYCSGKETAHLTAIFRRRWEKNGAVMGTRATPEQYQAVKAEVPEAVYDPVSRIIRAGNDEEKKIGRVAVCSAGTADLPVAEEAAQTAEFLGARVSRLYDIGVAGIHRLFHNLEELRSANCVVVAAGMEGALGSVVAGLVERPVIAVPTSVGYGASFGGVSALLSMLNSCANGIATVNIDNGYGAGYMAAQINRLAVNADE